MDRTLETMPIAATVLVVEDSATQREELCFVLEQSGYSVVTASNGEDGLAAAKTKAIDLVISDIVMPEMNGYALCEALRADKKLQHLPVILLTSLTDPRDVIRGLESGANNFICKPYEARALLMRVQNVLANQEIRKAAASEMGISIFFAGQRFFITADRLQILDLLLSTYESAMNRNRELISVRDQLRILNEQLEARVAERTAALAAEVAERKRAQEREHHLNRVLTAIRNVNQLIVREKDPGRLVQQACEMLVETRGYRAVWIAVDGRGGPPSLVAQAGWGEAFEALSLRLREGKLPPCWGRALAAESGLAVLDPRETCHECPLWKAYGPDAAGVAPLRHGARDFGTLAICLAPGARVDDEEASLLVEVASDLGLALHAMDTERRRAAYAQIVASSQDAMALVDCRYVFEEANPSCARLMGRDESAIVGHRAAEILGEEFFLRTGKPNLDRCFQGEIVSFETPWEVPGLGSRFIEAQYSPCRAPDGSVCSAAVSIRDITDRKQAEAEREKLEEQFRASQKLEAIGSLAGGIAHDFNNLLSVILCCTEFAMVRVRDDDQARDELLEVKKAGERAVALTRQILAFSRKQVLRPVVLNLNQITAGVEKMLRRILGEDVDYRQVLAPDLGMVWADPGQIEQVLMNLVVNARDAMPEGGKLTIETSNVELDAEYAARHVAVKPGPYVRFAITDTGCGMDERTQARIFEPFFTTKERGKGTGLGLSTVYGIVKQSGGNIWVYSEPGQGTAFKIYLPRDLSASVTVTSSRLAAVPTPSTGTETILVVEDEEAVRDIARRILREAGYTLLTAASPENALLTCKTQQGKIHLLVTDVVMPQMSGRLLAERLALERPGIKVLYMSGYTDDAIVHHGTLAPGTNFIGKPFSAADLTRKVREVLDSHVAKPADGHEQTAKPDSAMKGLDREALRGLPSEVLGKLRQAVVAARYDELVVLIEIIRNTDPRLASVLRGMADLFDYDGLRDTLS
jgi:PAS domain S-box-containing protein